MQPRHAPEREVVHQAYQVKIFACPKKNSPEKTISSWVKSFGEVVYWYKYDTQKLRFALSDDFFCIFCRLNGTLIGKCDVNTMIFPKSQPRSICLVEREPSNISSIAQCCKTHFLRITFMSINNFPKRFYPTRNSFLW